MVSDLFFYQISWNSNDWIARKRHVSAKAIGLNFSSNCACAAFNWVLSILKNPRIAGFFASLPFLKYLCYERLKPSTHCVQLRRKIAKIKRALSTKKWSLYQRHVCFYNPCARAESHQQEHVRKLCSATLRWFLRNKSYRWIFFKLSLNVLYQGLFRKIQ